MSDASTPAQTSERRYVERVLCAIIRDAEDAADRVAAMLKALGVKPCADRSDKSAASPETAVAARRVLRHWGAMVRIHAWKTAGLGGSLPPSLPSAADARDAAARIADGAADLEMTRALHDVEDVDVESDPIPAAVFRTWLERFALDGPEHLRADVVIDVGSSEPPDTLIEALAEFLWGLRGRVAGGEQNGTKT